MTIYAQPQVSQLVEVEVFRRSTNRKMWALIALFGVVAVVCLLITLATVGKPSSVVVYADGRPLLFEDTLTPGQQLDNMRIEAFTEEFIKAYVGLDSANIEEDFQKSLNMMTGALRSVVTAEGKEVERRRPYKDANVRTLFHDMKFRVGNYDASDHKGKVVLYSWGRMEYVPRFGEADPAKDKSEFFFSEVQLQRVAVTKKSLYGLQVDLTHTSVFATAADLETHLKKLSR